MNGEHLLTDELLLRRMFCEYLEMPGLRLTREQARRLWGLDEATCVKLLDGLVALKFLVRRSDGRYIRSTDGSADATLAAMVKASLHPRTAIAPTAGRQERLIAGRTYR